MADEIDKNMFWQPSYYTDSKGNKKLSRNRVAYVNGKQIVEGSIDDIYDEYGNIDRDKEAAKQKKKNETSSAGMTGASKNNIPTSVDAQQQLVKDTAREFNTDEKTAAKIAGRVAGGNNSTPAQAEAIRTDTNVNVPKAGPSDNSNPATYKGAEQEIGDIQSIFDKVNDYYGNSLTGFYDDLSNRDKKIMGIDSALTLAKNLAKAQPYLGSIYGRSHEGSDIGDEKSMLDEAMRTSLNQGLDRRNKRMTATLDAQIEAANFPAEIKRTLYEINARNDLDFRQKQRLMTLEIEQYKKNAGIDISKDKAIRTNAAEAPYRFTGGVNVGGVNVGAQ